MVIAAKPYDPLKHILRGEDKRLEDVILRFAGYQLGYYLELDEHGRLGKDPKVKPEFYERVHLGKERLEALGSRTLQDWQTKWDEAKSGWPNNKHTQAIEKLQNDLDRCRLLLTEIATSVWRPNEEYRDFEVHIVEEIDRKMSRIQSEIIGHFNMLITPSWMLDLNSFISWEIQKAQSQLKVDEEELAKTEQKLSWAKRLFDNLPQ